MQAQDNSPSSLGMSAGRGLSSPNPDCFWSGATDPGRKTSIAFQGFLKGWAAASRRPRHLLDGFFGTGFFCHPSCKNLLLEEDGGKSEIDHYTKIILVLVSSWIAHWDSFLAACPEQLEEKNQTKTKKVVKWILSESMKLLLDTFFLQAVPFPAPAHQAPAHPPGSPGADGCQQPHWNWPRILPAPAGDQSSQNTLHRACAVSTV